MSGAGDAIPVKDSITVSPHLLQEMTSLISGLPRDLIDAAGLLSYGINDAVNATDSAQLKAALEQFLHSWNAALTDMANGIADMSKGLTKAADHYLASDHHAAKRMQNVG